MSILIATYFGLTFTFGVFPSDAACQKAVKYNVSNCPACAIVWKCERAQKAEAKGEREVVDALPPDGWERRAYESLTGAQ